MMLRVSLFQCSRFNDVNNRLAYKAPLFQFGSFVMLIVSSTLTPASKILNPKETVVKHPFAPQFFDDIGNKCAKPLPLDLTYSWRLISVLLNTVVM